MNFEETLAEIREQLDAAETDLDYEYEKEVTANLYLSVEINNGGSMDYELADTDVEISLCVRDLADETIPTALARIRELVDELAKQGINLPDGDDDPFQLREPWPGSAAARAAKTTTPEFAQQYDPPLGYRYSGEFRPWKKGEIFLNRNGRVEMSTNNGPASKSRHILIPEATTQLPHGAYTKDIEAAPPRIETEIDF